MIEHITSDLMQFFQALVEISKNFGIQPWWRGHLVHDWDLVPSIHHKGFSAKEHNLSVLFRSSAKARYNNCPDNNNFPGWLFLMQHYGLPTRLLDWSTSPLVALFFAIEDKKYDNKDAAVWALNPGTLNKEQVSLNKIPSADHSMLSNFFRDAFQVTKSAKPLIVAALPDHTDLRHMLQQSAFTIHGTDIPINKSDKDFVVKITIPSSSKEGFRKSLSVLGISCSSIFPDLDNLSKYLVSLNFTKDE